MHGDDSWTERRRVAKSARHDRLDAIAWAMFFMWVGVAILADIGWGWFLVGIGVIVLSVQAAHSRAGEPVDAVSIVCGTVFLAGGLWQTLGLTWPLAPILLILLGAAMLWRALFSAPDRRP